MNFSDLKLSEKEIDELYKIDLAIALAFLGWEKIEQADDDVSELPFYIGPLLAEGELRRSHYPSTRKMGFRSYPDLPQFGLPSATLNPVETNKLIELMRNRGFEIAMIGTAKEWKVAFVKDGEIRNLEKAPRFGVAVCKAALRTLNS